MEAQAPGESTPIQAARAISAVSDVHVHTASDSECPWQYWRVFLASSGQRAWQAQCSVSVHEQLRWKAREAMYVAGYASPDVGEGSCDGTESVLLQEKRGIPSARTEGCGACGAPLVHTGLARLDSTKRLG